MSKSILGIIMAGGTGTRLWPLTKDRAKPAVPIAGKFRLIDIPISNCINSDIKQIFVLTQYNSESLNRHIYRTYAFDRFSQGFVMILAAQQTLEYSDWYQGTADSVRKNLRYFLDNQHDHYLILAGDHLYSMDYQQLMKFHLEKDADITVGVLPVPRQKTSEFGILKLDGDSRVTSFMEKPKTEQDLEPFAASAEWMRSQGHQASGDEFMGSMGIYLFNRKILMEMLTETDHTDFGKGVIPHAIKTKRVYGYLFNGYWEDVGTVQSFYRAMMDLVVPFPKFNFYEAKRRIFTRPRYLPGAKITDCQVRQSVINEGTILEECRVESSMVGIRSRVNGGTQILRSVIMGADYYETPEELAENRGLGRPDIGIGRDCVIEKAIIDKNARVGDGVQILDRNRGQNMETENYVIRDGIVIVPKNSTLPPGTLIG
jgi:glucose-1-phosphate adenylyltransferase